MPTPRWSGRWEQQREADGGTPFTPFPDEIERREIEIADKSDGGMPPSRNVSRG